MKRQTGTDKVSSATRGATVMSSSCLLAGLCPTDLVTFTFQDQCQVCTHSRTVSYRHCHLYVPGSMSGMYTLPDCVLQTLSPLRSRISGRYVPTGASEHCHYNNNNDSYIALYPVNIYKLAALYIITIKIRMTIKKVPVL